jgi:signal transduction histidine kinase
LASIPDSEEKRNIQESLESIGKNSEYISKILADLQDYARPLNPLSEKTDLTVIINDLTAKNGLPAKIKAYSSVENEAARITADPAFIRRILGNLVSNAVQAMPRGGKLSISAYKESDDIVIRVKDTGVGIPDHVKPELFTPLFTTKSRGQGFGLAVCKRLVEALNGTITFWSEEGKGTEFIVRLPSRKNKH